MVRSGLTKKLRYVEVVSTKTLEAYRNLFQKYEIDPSKVLMVENSLRSDVIPVLKIGSQAVYIPYVTAWTHERVHEDVLEKYSYFELTSITQLPDLISGINNK